MMFSTIRPATIDDIDWIVQEERRPDFAEFILDWSLEQHRQNLSNPDMSYWLALGPEKQRVGYAILRGILSPENNIEIVRMTVVKPGTGIGQPFFHALMDEIFNNLGTHRLWFDVFEDNKRARHTYRTLGFTEEGVMREVTCKKDGQRASLVMCSMLVHEYYTQILPRLQRATG